MNVCLSYKSLIIHIKYCSKSLLPFALSLLPFLAFSQYFPSKNYPQNYFRNPLGIPIELSGNFGQLRSDHFHMGLDIRTKQKENLSVFAAAEGYISRIKIERFGYGRAIYITHPNGLTTLYAHLNNFYDTLNKFLIAKQYKEEKWEQDFELKPNQFKVSKGQFIAFSGNTGGSRGAHLHFEIRDKQGNNLNPQLFGMPVLDNAPPIINRFFIYDRNYSTYHNPPEQIDINGSKGNYSSKDSIVTINSNKISFGISAEDVVAKVPFRLGIYQAEVWVDSAAVFAFRINDFSYPNSRYINACIDYEERFSGDTYIQHLSKLPGNHLPIFSSSLQNGVIELNDTLIHHAEIIIKDVDGNSSNLSFLFRRKDSVSNIHVTEVGTNNLPPSKEFDYEKDGIRLSFNELAFYDTVPFRCDVKPATAQAVSPSYSLCCPEIPVHTYYDAAIKLEQPIPDSLRSKVLMQLKIGKYADATKGNWDGNWMNASFDRLGSLQLVIDTITPTIEFANLKKDSIFDNETIILIEAKDNLSSIKKFRAELDGKWLMFSRKDNYFIYTFDERCPLGKHVLTVSVEDETGNISQQQVSFSKEKPKPKPKPSKKKRKPSNKKKTTKKKKK
jgi:murein DD-endopeptidase MepM/ murein hydrolase activator NlpD